MLLGGKDKKYLRAGTVGTFLQACPYLRVPSGDMEKASVCVDTVCPASSMWRALVPTAPLA